MQYALKIFVMYLKTESDTYFGGIDGISIVDVKYHMDCVK